MDFSFGGGFMPGTGAGGGTNGTPAWQTIFQDGFRTLGSVLNYNVQQAAIERGMSSANVQTPGQSSVITGVAASAQALPSWIWLGVALLIVIMILKK